MQTTGAADGEIGGFGDVLDACQRLIDCEHVGDVLCALFSELVVRETAKARQREASMAASTCVRKLAHNAHLMDCKVEFTVSISVMAMMPSAV